MLATFFRQITDDEKKKAGHGRRHHPQPPALVAGLQSFGQWVLKAARLRAVLEVGGVVGAGLPQAVRPRATSTTAGSSCRRSTAATTRRAADAPPGFLFTVPAFGLNQERAERRRTLDERTELVAELTKGLRQRRRLVPPERRGRPAGEGHQGGRPGQGLAEHGREGGVDPRLPHGQARVLVTKPKIAGLGLNLQHCAHVVTFVTHSYEQFYQCVRRCWRFGQKRPVTLDVIATEGEVNVKRNMDRKEKLAARCSTASSGS
jgi:hypothetical protein